MHAVQRRRRETPLLTRDSIVTTALGIIRSEGLDALTMRRVARAMNVAPMSLYRHIADREDLILGIMNRVAEGMELPPEDESPEHELMALVRTLHKVFRKDPWIILVFANQGLASPLALTLLDRVFACLYRMGLDGKAAINAWQLVSQYLYGEALAGRLAEEQTYATRLLCEADRDRFPHLARMLADSPGPGHVEEDFEVNLAALVNRLRPGS
ncbi:TetR/AcrR family transcriptional regulator C-terminal domain-containing protein [Brooklawnia cerclae]|uniref:AcrR family transcriptional regulator n=1 Tax=Brooklawnia cerclae TaxID=349934 RepID=A0ABX0SGI8_9ACTN|nr:TetR/AcrR family transcriptional regulator [Brooklawnia cerclae]NIH57091.1 AcrR family transcriptional regulator [Brooklawnia cerclae]